MVDLTPQSNFSSNAIAVSSDGSAVAGSYSNGGGGLVGNSSAFRWTEATGLVDLGTLPGFSVFRASAISGNGSVVVGTAETTGDPFVAPNIGRAFRWTQASGMTDLGTLSGGTISAATATNVDGRVVVGVSNVADSTAGVRAFRWTPSGGMVNLGTLTPGSSSVASGVSLDGNVIVGTAFNGSGGLFPFQGDGQAFRWTQAGGMKGLGFLTGGNFSQATAVSGDGKVVVGVASVSSVVNGGVPTVLTQSGFRWTDASGMQTVEAWLRAGGVNLPANTATLFPHSTNRDGSVVVGQYGDGPQLPFFARVSPIGSGMVTLQGLQSSLSGNTSAGTQAANLGGMVINGAHSRPLSHRVETGKSCVWTAGDIGRDDHGERDGTFGLVEVGGCHRLTQNLQGSLSVGRTSSRQNLVFNGSSTVSTTYGIAELLGRIPGTNLWPSAALMYQAGEADARRGYLNAGVQDISIGRPGVNTTALRLRTDWDGALTMGNTSLTPYADITHARTRINAYIESGGGFPALFDARSEKSTEAHVGVDATYAVSSSTKLLGRIDAAHRFENNAAATSGTVLGLFSFNLPGQKIKRDWIRAGVGFDTKLGAGVASAFLNATTQGAAPNHWLNVSYQVAF